MNDTIVVFDRIRENAAKYRDRPFAKMVNQSINETLSRTILTAATLFFVTVAMNIFSTGVIRDFAFAMNVGVIVGTYSTIFIAAPVLIWLNDKYVASQKKRSTRSDRQGRKPSGAARTTTGIRPRSEGRVRGSLCHPESRQKMAGPARSTRVSAPRWRRPCASAR